MILFYIFTRRLQPGFGFSYIATVTIIIGLIFISSFMYLITSDPFLAGSQV